MKNNTTTDLQKLHELLQESLSDLKLLQESLSDLKLLEDILIPDSFRINVWDDTISEEKYITFRQDYEDYNLDKLNSQLSSMDKIYSIVKHINSHKKYLS